MAQHVSDLAQVKRGLSTRCEQDVPWAHTRSLCGAPALDTAHHPHIAEPDDRPVYSRLLTFPRVRGQCVGAFAEFSSDLQLLCTD